MEDNTGKINTSPEENIIKHPLDEIVQKGAQAMLQKALEIEVDLFLERYQYILDDQGNRQIVRNGHNKPRKIVTGAGQVEIETPRVDDRILEKHNESRFSSSIIPPYLKRTKNIDELVPILYLKGISTGDFTEALESILGKEVIGLSSANIVRLKAVWEKEYQDWVTRDLSQVEYVYWWVDGIYFNVRLDDERQCILIIIGAKLDGTKEVLAIADGFRESKQSWLSVLRELKRLGLTKPPKLAIGDGALGFWSALEEEFPVCDQQLCWVHKTANVLDKLPQSQQGKAKIMLHNIYQAANKKDANLAFDIFIEDYDQKYPKAVDSLRNHREQLMTFYKYPAGHWRHIRSTNIIESTFATVRHRTKRTKGCGSRVATLTMVFKLIQSAQRRWRILYNYKKIEDVWRGVKFEDGFEVANQQSTALELAGRN